MANNVTVAQHQANYSRIQLLRQTAETLDNQIKSTITTLAETRKELLNTPFTTFPDSSNAVSVDELLSYAKRIAPFTVPPTSFQAAVAAEEANQNPADSNKDTATAVANGTGAATPAAVTAGQNAGSQTQTPGAGSQQDTGFASQLSGNLQSSLGQPVQPRFVPWPDENRMVASALMDVKAQIERGENPATKNLVPEELARVDEERMRKLEEDEERWRRQEEEDRQKMESYRAVGIGNQSALVGGTVAGTRARQEFRGFGLYDPDEEE